MNNIVEIFRDFLASDNEKAKAIRDRNTKEIPDEYIEAAFIGCFENRKDFVLDKLLNNYLFNVDKIPGAEWKVIKTFLDCEAIYNELIDFHDIVEIGNFYFDVSEL